MPVDHVERARQAWPILAKRANEKGKPFTYGELCAELGLHPRTASWFLGVIQEHCKREKLPALQALAVNKKTGLPGPGYAGSMRTPESHKAALHKVHHEHTWSLQPPRFPPQEPVRRR